MAAPFSSGFYLHFNWDKLPSCYARQINQQCRLGMPLKQRGLSQLSMSMEFVRHIRKVKSNVNVQRRI